MNRKFKLNVGRILWPSCVPSAAGHFCIYFARWNFLFIVEQWPFVLLIAGVLARGVTFFKRTRKMEM